MEPVRNIQSEHWFMMVYVGLGQEKALHIHSWVSCVFFCIKWMKRIDIDS